VQFTVCLRLIDIAYILVKYAVISFHFSLNKLCVVFSFISPYFRKIILLRLSYVSLFLLAFIISLLE
jgi:hypothetical protein